MFNGVPGRLTRKMNIVINCTHQNYYAWRVEDKTRDKIPTMGAI